MNGEPTKDEEAQAYAQTGHSDLVGRLRHRAGMMRQSKLTQSSWLSGSTPDMLDEAAAALTAQAAEIERLREALTETERERRRLEPKKAWTGRRFRFNGQQEAEAIAHFQKLLRPWRREFLEDNWPTTAAHLHELLHRAMLREGAAPDWIAFAVGGDIARRAVVAEVELGKLTPEMRAIEKAAQAIESHTPESLVCARAAVLAFLDGVDPREIGYAAATIRDNRDCDKTEAVLAALRAEAGEKP